MISGARLSTLLGTRVRVVFDFGASHAWTLHRAELADGRVVFVKAAPEPTRVFTAESTGLSWLRHGDADHAEVPGSIDAPVVRVLAADDRTLIVPWLEDSGPTPVVADRFGRELAAIHARRPELFGAPWAGWIANLPLSNAQTSGPWAGWYAEHRLAPYLPRAAPYLGTEGIRLVEKVIDHIDALAGPVEPPARIHGDLWAGNIVWTSERAMLIDPAAHGGHRETDLAMLALFGAPYLDRVCAAYHETFPLADGWRARTPLHQLHPLLVHMVLFGASYRAQTLAAASAALAG
ncbi:fructosamine kinase family protein [Nocardia sp. CNY236]|uniref:fructosamine kinase family protein n=1 Tax=Nocardia sp. CNY236 TaxID=1169152 RepID=UPI00041FE070|nr:fructosamine kinase family protein [Nocardia sp. CNY236]